MDLKYLRTNNIVAGKNDEVVNYINNLYDAASKTYLKQQKDWYINDRFARGEHWIAYNKVLNKILTIPVVPGEVRRTVNKIRSQIRGIKNFIKRNQPRWEVHPNDATNDAYTEAAKKNKILQHIYTTRYVPSKLTDVIVNSLKYSVGILEAGVIKKNGSDRIDCWVDDTFDIVFDPSATCVDDCRFIIKAMPKPVEYVLNNSSYTIKDKNLTTDGKLSASEYKEILEREKYNKEQSTGNKDLETVIVKELWIKYFDGETKIKVITIAGDKILSVYQPRYKRYPFFIYNPEKTSNSIYSDPWIKDLISMNKSLNKTISQVESYIQRMLAGKYLIKHGVEVSTITDKGAEMVYYKGNAAPSQQNLQPLPAVSLEYIRDMESFIEELGGIRAASLGKAPGSLQSGKALEALQAADASTVAEPIENLEILLSEFAEFCLELINEYQIVTEEIVEGGEKIKYVGKFDNVPEDALQIGANEKVRVSIVPEVAYSEDAKREWAVRLAEAKLIDPRAILEIFKFSNVSDIIERMEAIKEEEYKKEMMKQNMSHQAAGQNGPQDTADLADQENMKMASGQQVPITPKVLWTPEHLKLHMAFINENKDAYNQRKDLFQPHILNEEKYAGVGGEQETPQQLPQ